ncbi:MAG: RIP metalloprotease RseP [Tenuifilaceae bacterium]|nr:RIP metalloprotease RseP [Tenuifilaceae bacterium]
MGIFNQIIQFLFSLSILITLHELGHFAFARLFNTRVEKFYLFFDPWFSLFKIKRGHTEYGIGWIPLGGYVKIAGMIDESMDTEQLNNPPKPWEYRSKPAWQRFLIISAGVMVNFILGALIYTFILYTWGEQYLPTQNAIYGVTCDPLARDMGFEDGDKIIYVDGEQIESFMQIAPTIVIDNAQQVTVERNNNLVDVRIDKAYIPQLLKTQFLFLPRVPMVVNFVSEGSAAQQANIMPNDKLVAINNTKATFLDEFKAVVQQNINNTVTITMEREGRNIDLTVNVPETGIIGVATQSPFEILELRKNKYSFLQSIPAGIKKGANTITSYLKQLKLVFSPKTKAYESVGGFIAIGSIFPTYWDWQSFWELTALLSIILAIMNMLPIPALDGGHMVFIIYEMVSGRKPSDKFMEYTQILGMLFILALFIFANANDVIKLFR